jgi:hypothetical protein
MTKLSPDTPVEVTQEPKERAKVLAAKLEAVYREMGNVGSVIGRKSTLSKDDLAQVLMVSSWQKPIWDAKLALAAADSRIKELTEQNAECHNIVGWLWAITESEDAELMKRVHAVLGIDDGDCGNPICGDLLELRLAKDAAEARNTELEQDIRLLKLALDEEGGFTKLAEARIALLMPLVEGLQRFIRPLRIDASGEDGRMPATDMYELADRLAALVGAQTRQETTEKDDDD